MWFAAYNSASTPNKQDESSRPFAKPRIPEAFIKTKKRHLRAAFDVFTTE